MGPPKDPRLPHAVNGCTAVGKTQADRSHDETAELAAKVFELSQTLRSQWLTADYAAKRRILEIVFLNCSLDGVTLVPTMRKPFDVLAEGLVSENSRGDKTPLELFIAGIQGWEAELRRQFENRKSR